MNRLFIHPLVAAGLLILPVSAAPVINGAAVANVTASGACVAWEFTEDSYPGVAVFADAAGTNEVTTQVRVEVQALEHARREVSSTLASRAANRELQDAMSARRIAFVRLGGLLPETSYFIRPLALAAPGGAVVSQGELVPFTTARTAAFVPEARQLAVDLSSIVPTTGPVEGAVLFATHAQSRYPLAAVVGDGPSSTHAYFDLTLLLDAAGERNLLPPSGPLELTLSWLGLPPLTGYFSPNAVAYTGAPQVAALTTSVFVGEGFVIRATPAGSTALVGFPLEVALSVTDISGAVETSFTQPLAVASPALAFGAGNTEPLVEGLLPDHQLVFSTPGVQTVTVSDPASGVSTSFDITVLPMTYQNWRDRLLGGDLAAGGPHGNPDIDPFANFIEFIHGADPLARDAALMGAVQPPSDKALAIRFWLNPYQTEYRVVIQVSADLLTWRRSPKTPVVLQAEPDGNLMEASWSQSELEAETGVAGNGYFARLAWEPATSFGTFAQRYGLSGATAASSADPDGDGKSNHYEFALDDNPVSGASSGKVRQTTVSHNGVTAQVLTIPMRLGALPAASDPPGGELVFEVAADGLRYRIQGSANLVHWTVTMTEVPAVTAGLPQLSPGYEYRSFQSAGGFLEFVRVRVEQFGTQPTGFEAFVQSYGLIGPAAAASADPDGDGKSNFREFALDDNPVSGAASGKVRQTTVDHNGVTAQVLTIPMRLGALPAASDPPGGELAFEVAADGLRYRIQGSNNLTDWTVTMTEVPAVTAGLPPPSPGYEYRSFQSAGGGFEFVRVRIEQF
jgi:hypothetical protein